MGDLNPDDFRRIGYSDDSNEDISPFAKEKGESFSVEPASSPTTDFSEVVSSMSTLILGFVLILCLWDTWSTFTDIVAPMPEFLFVRCLLNILLLIASCAILKRFTNREESKRTIMFGNLLGGIGIWEFAETLIESAFGDNTWLKLMFFSSCLVVTYLLVLYLERNHRLNVMDSPFMSPI